MNRLIFLIIFLFSNLATAKTEWNAVEFKAATTYSALTASTVPYLNASKVLTSSAVTSTELGYLSGVTSAIQTQLTANTVKTLKKQIFTSSGTFTIPSETLSTTVFKFTIIGGGGGGGGVQSASSKGSAGDGGGGGGTAIKWLSGLTAGNTIAVTVGTGGTAGSAGQNNGSAGNNSTIASGTETITTVTGGGGSGGTGNGPDTSLVIKGSASGGTASNGDININGGKSIPGYVFSASQVCSGIGGASSIGGGGRVQTNTTANGLAGDIYGAGGSGGIQINDGGDRAGGNGSDGIVIVEWVL